MITPRRLTLLAVVSLVVIVAAGWLASRHTVPESAPSGGAVLPGLKAKINEVTSLRLASKGAAVTLERAGDGWIVRERNYPADTAKLRKLLLGLAALAVAEEKTRDPANYAQLGVEDAGPASSSVLIEAVTPGKPYSLLVGHAVGGTGNFVRVPGEAQSLFATPQVSSDIDPKHWIDTALTDITADRVKALTVTPSTGIAWQAARDAATDPLTLQGLPKGRKQRGPDVVTPVAALLVGLHAEDVHALPSDAPAKARVIVHSFDGLEIELAGREDGDHRYIRGTATSTGDAAAKEAAALDAKLKGREFEIPRYKYDALFRPLSDFI
ncbi:MAG TPA: DUF4340 domain-containing protein [Steroidobacteraceae bacterium]|nr:DUF4340 domain-containing protein [Steroidobacteraceae bacterium]HQX78323.1 DUF4340 domain-containing protein [Steroidobacteraceae bacterium]